MEKRLWTPVEARDHLAKTKLPEEPLRVSELEIAKMETYPKGSSEFRKAQLRFDWLVSMPWDSAPSQVDINRIDGVLGTVLYAQEEAKATLMSHLVSKPVGMSKPVFYIMGDRGTGKSRLAEGVGLALDRPIIKIRASTIRKEEELSGSTEKPGELAKIFRDIGRMDPVIIIEDAHNISGECPLLTMMAAYQEGALYKDNFLDAHLDLSKVTLVATGLVHPVWIVEMHSYTMLDKIEIAGRYIIPETCSWLGMKKPLMFEREAVELLCLMYTREAGTNKLRDRISSILRRSELLKLRGRKLRKIKLSDVPLLLGPPKFGGPEKPHEGVGKVNALAYNGVGGDLLKIHCLALPMSPGASESQVCLTGNLGPILKESAQVALTFVRANAKALGIKRRALDTMDLHIHCQDGATPKEGPSAGAALVLAMTSALRGKPVRGGIGLTGEINLSGELIGIGGVHEKIEAALKSHLGVIILPAENERDIFKVRSNLPNFADTRIMGSVVDVVKFALDGETNLGKRIQVNLQKKGKRKKAAKKPAKKKRPYKAKPAKKASNQPEKNQKGSTMPSSGGASPIDVPTTTSTG
jgi:ATP-dependent Lon protease